MDSSAHETEHSGLESDYSDSHYPPLKQDISSSVQDFLRQSSEIHAEIKYISRLCHRAPPEAGRKDRASLDTEVLNRENEQEIGDSDLNWNHMNELLVNHGLNEVFLYQDEELQDLPDLSSLFETLLGALTELSANRRERATLHSNLKTLQTENKELNRKLKPTFKPTEVPPEPCKELLKDIVNQLSVQSHDDIMGAIIKLQEVMEALPKVEQFMGLIYNEVVSDSQNTKPGEVIAAIRNWRIHSSKLGKLTEALGGAKEHSYERAKGMGHFCRLFQVENSKIRETVDQLYYFVFEIKNFLSFVRNVYGLPPESSVKRVLREIARTLHSKI